jgi:tripartite-type tricarboxylate transporter receptor subunit TctC
MKIPHRRQFLRLAAGTAALPTVSRLARAQAYPTRPITMIVPFPPGGPNDVIGRVVAERMRNSLGQPIIIENVSGADGSIGVGRAARARADGYTILIGNKGAVLNGGFYSLPYDVVNDFAPVSPLAMFPLILFAGRTIPAKDLSELIAWLKANPNTVSAGIPVLGVHLETALFQKLTGTQFVFAPYRGSGPATQDLVAGHINLLFETPVQLPLVQAGSIKAFAVTSDTRLAFAPDIPTFHELGLPALSYSSWLGLFTPRGASKEVIMKLNAAVAEALADSAVRSRLVDLGLQVFPRERQTPEELDALVKADAAKWWPIIKESGIKPQ